MTTPLMGALTVDWGSQVGLLVLWWRPGIWYRTSGASKDTRAATGQEEAARHGRYLPYRTDNT